MQVEPSGTRSQESAAILHRESESWGRLIRDNEINIE